MINQRINVSLLFVVVFSWSGGCPAALDEAAAALQDKDFATAIRHLDDASQEERNATQWQLLRAAAEAGNGDLKKAERRYLALIKRMPQMPEAYNNLAAIYARQGRLDEAMELLEKAMDTNESYATVYANLRSIYYEMSRSAYAKALQMEKRKDGPALRPILLAAAVGKPQQAVVEAPQVAVAAEAPVEPVTAVQPAPVKEPASEPVAVKNVALMEIDSVAPPPQENPNTNKLRRDEVIGMLRSWAADWAGQRVDAYLAAYADGFRPRRGMSREQWRVQRRERLSRPEDIKVQLADFKVQFRGKERASVTLIQSYRSKRYSDRVRKHFQLLRTVDGWKIVTEKTIEVL